MDNTENIYRAPDSNVDEGEETPIKPGWVLKTIATTLTLVTSSLSFLLGLWRANAIGMNAGSDSFGYLVGYLIGSTAAPALLSCLIIGLFQIGKRFRNSRSRLKILSWCMFVFLLSAINQTFAFLKLIE